ncbi:MAG: flagellar biosynthesis protein FliQ [Armatimonadota bacterium]
MTDSTILDLCRQAFVTALLCSGPILSVVLVIGVAVSIMQAVTQVQEATLTFLPKLIAAGLVTVMAGGWMLDHLVRLTEQLFGNLSQYVR